MAAWRASLGACGLALVATSAAASPIAELEALLRAQAKAQAPAARSGFEPAATVVRDGLPWNYAVVERDRNVRSAAIDPHTPIATPPAETSSDLSSSVGCVVGGTVGATIASLGGGLNTINMIGGGVVSAINPVTFYVSLVGVVFISFCQLGQALTPLYLHLTAPTPPEPVIGPPQAAPPPALDNLPDFRRNPPLEHRPGVPMVRAADRPGEWVTTPPRRDQRDCVQDRRSIRLAMSAITHGAAIPPSCSGSLI